MKYQAVELSEQGQSPASNQDSVFFQTVNGIGFFALADGMGGYDAGNIASRLTIEKVYKYLQETITETVNGDAQSYLSAHLEAGIKQANEFVYQYAEEHDFVMGSTITCALLFGSTIIVANVGDSRTYLIRGTDLKRLTTDHSLVEHLVQSGAISEEERYSNNHVHIVTRGIGNQPEVKVDLFTYSVAVGDQLLLCSDGLWGAFPQQEHIVNQLQSEMALEQLGKRLIQKAVNEGSQDHVSLVLVQLMANNL